MAGKIPEHFIDDVLARTDLVELIGSQVRLKKSGKNYAACCPFHDEKTPSFTVSPDKQFYYCFGCGASGNAIGFQMDYVREGFVEAIEGLAQKLGLEVPREGGGQFEKKDNSGLYDILEKANQFFQSQLKNPKIREKAVSYLKRRGLSGETAKRFQIGYAPPGWDNLISQFADTEKKRQQLIDAGLTVRNDNGREYDRFRDRIMFPIRDMRGRTIAFGGRVLGNDKPKYLNSPETDVFHKSRELYGLYDARKHPQKFERAVVVEGYMDVIALTHHGIHYSVATLGTASNQDHIEKLFRYVSEVVFCFDGDAAGRKAANRALENSLPCMKDGRQIRFLILPEGEDPDTLVNKDGPEVLEEQFRTATPLSERFFSALSEDIDIDTMDGKARLASQAAPLLDKLPQGVFRQLMLGKLASITELSTESLENAISVSSTPTPPVTAQKSTQRPAQQSQHNEGQSSPENHPKHDGGYPGGDFPMPDDYYPPQDYDGFPGGEPTMDNFAPPQFPEHQQFPDQQQGSKPGFKKKKWKGKKGFKKGKNNYFDDDEPILPAAPVTPIIDSVIRIILHTPKDAANTDLSHNLLHFQSPYMELLRDLLSLLKERPEASTAAILGRWHATEEGEHLAQLAAKEFLIPQEISAPELQDALRKLEQAKVESDLDELIKDGAKDKTKLRELLKLQQLLAQEPEKPE
ncbi:DNA primase [Gammaproteobacteria bacterium 45_16_T64]|nr:DNA primase [Gammaproteobacteria bacterium 45_16_T64]